MYTGAADTRAAARSGDTGDLCRNRAPLAVALDPAVAVAADPLPAIRVFVRGAGNNLREIPEEADFHIFDAEILDGDRVHRGFEKGGAIDQLPVRLDADEVFGDELIVAARV